MLHHGCPRCSIPYNHPDTRGVCGDCQQHPPAFQRAIALYHYSPPVDHFIRELKFHRQLGLARLLGERLASRLSSESARPDLIIPVPLHRNRLRERGYNQALEIARPLARVLGVPLDARCLIRKRATPPQAGLSLAARRRNLKDAFVVKHPQAVHGRCVALVDDVMTTGSTVQFASRALRAAGAEEVWVWVVARA